MAEHATPRTFCPIAEELYQLAIERGYPHCTLLNKAADELKRLWNVAEDRYWAGQRMEGVLETLEAAIKKYGRHLRGCKREDMLPCSCGFFRMLQDSDIETEGDANG